MRAASERFDAVIVDFPDPDTDDLAKLYSLELFEHASGAGRLAPGGRIVVQAGSPYFAPDAFWCIERTRAGGRLRDAAVPRGRAVVRRLGLRAGRRRRNGRALHARAPRPLRFLDGATLRAASVFPRRSGQARARVSTLDRPAIVTYGRRGWRDE